VLFDFLSTTRKVGERVYASKEKSCRKEKDRKEEIRFLYTHTLFLGWRRDSSAFFYGLLFLRSLGIMKLHS
jgi:hypothetical protein